jgi:uncharacterized repeat protein (TIGR01451 family)
VAGLPASRGQSWPTGLPERFGVVNLIPFWSSGETNCDAEPSLAVGTGANFGELAVHAFTGAKGSWGLSQVFTSQNRFNQWTNLVFNDADATLDWSPGGTAYIAYLGIPAGTVLEIGSSAAPNEGFTQIGNGTINDHGLDQPRVHVVTVGGQDRIYVGYNHVSSVAAPSANVWFSLDSGNTWTNVTIERVTPGAGRDSPAVPMAVSPQGQTVYALFQRFNSATNGGDYFADVVLVRDDNSGLDGFGDLPLDAHNVPETGVATNVVVPWSSTLGGVQRLGSGCSVAVHPNHPNQVYVAETSQGADSAFHITVHYSSDSGQTFQAVFTTSLPSSLPALAVTTEGTVGLLYLAAPSTPDFTHNTLGYEVHLFKAYGGNFTDTADHILAKFPIGDPPDDSGQPYVGDYFDLKAVGHDLYGVFSASGDPQASHFPQGVYYQRYVQYGTTITNNFSLTTDGGQLVDVYGNPVSPSIDPFFFYDIAPRMFRVAGLEYVAPPTFYERDPLAGLHHFVWPLLPASYPQFQLQDTMTIEWPMTAMWGANNETTVADNLYVAPMDLSSPMQFYGLSQQVEGWNFPVFISEDGRGVLDPNGVILVGGRQGQTFTATPNDSFAVGEWYLDGIPAQTGGPTFAVADVTAEHTVHATFIASNDLAVTISSLPLAQGPVLVGQELDYTLRVANLGLNPLTGIMLTNYFDPSVSFLSASSSQGSVTNLGAYLAGGLSELDRGAVATVRIGVLPTMEGRITNVVTVACDQPEPDLANNTAMDVANVLSPLVITNQPQSQTIPPGGTALFTVGVSGTPPIAYQWYFNGTPIAAQTNNTLELDNVTSAQTGSYSVDVFQVTAGAADEAEVDSQPAILTVAVTPPSVTTLGASGITSNSVVLNGYVIPNGAPATYYFEYGPTASYGNVTGSSTVGSTQTVALAIGGLAASTTYHYRIDAYDSAGTNYGADVAFTTLSGTPPPPPIVETLFATNITATSADLWGSVYGNGSAVAGYFEYGLTDSYGSKSPQFFGAGNPVEDFDAVITNLAPSTTYHFRIVAFNAVAEGLGDDMTFTTANLVGQPPPTVQTLPASSITTGSAILNATVNPNGLETHAYFEYGTTTSYGSTTALEDLGAGGAVQDLQYALNLASGTTYHYRIDAYNSAGTSLGADVVFTTGTTQPPPTVQTLPASSVTDSSAVLNGNVNPNGDSSTSAYFEYGLTTSYGTITTQTGIGATAQNFSATISGLTPSTTYHYRIDAANTGGSSRGADATFTTAAVPVQPPPTVQTLGANLVTTNGAFINATVNPNGADTDAYFEWGTTPSYGNETTLEDLGSGTAVQSINSYLTLAPSTTYYYRIVAYNSGGTSFGTDTNFTTLAMPQPPPTVQVQPATLVTTTTAVLNGTVNPNGADTHAQFQWGATTSYGNTTILADVGSGSSSQNLQGKIGALAPSTTYHYRIYADNSGGTSYSPDATFTTAAQPAPTATTEFATEILDTSAILNASVNPNGASTTVYFQYGTTTAYGQWTGSVILTGTAATNVSFTISGLPTLTFYYFRVVAYNSGGTSYGASSVFETGGNR